MLSGRLELPTLRFTTSRSNQLRYGSPAVRMATQRERERERERESERGREEAKEKEKEMVKEKMKETELAIPGSMGRCLIHWATGPPNYIGE